MVQSQLLPEHPENERNLSSEAMAAAELKMSSEAVRLTDFETTGNEDDNLASEALIDLEIIAIYW